MKVYVLCSGEPDSEIYGVFPTEDEAIEWAARNGPPPNNRHVVEAELHTIAGTSREDLEFAESLFRRAINTPTADDAPPR
jgi:hypothetical protein